MAHSQSDFNHQRFPLYVQFLEVTITKFSPHKTHNLIKQIEISAIKNIQTSLPSKKKVPKQKTYPKYTLQHRLSPYKPRYTARWNTGPSGWWSLESVGWGLGTRPLPVIFGNFNELTSR